MPRARDREDLELIGRLESPAACPCRPRAPEWLSRQSSNHHSPIRNAQGEPPHAFAVRPYCHTVPWHFQAVAAHDRGICPLASPPRQGARGHPRQPIGNGTHSPAQAPDGAKHDAPCKLLRAWAGTRHSSRHPRRLSAWHGRHLSAPLASSQIPGRLPPARADPRHSTFWPHRGRHPHATAPGRRPPRPCAGITAPTLQPRPKRPSLPAVTRHRGQRRRAGTPRQAAQGTVTGGWPCGCQGPRNPSSCSISQKVTVHHSALTAPALERPRFQALQGLASRQAARAHVSVQRLCTESCTN